jgi:hypothetical protein
MIFSSVLGICAVISIISIIELRNTLFRPTELSLRCIFDEFARYRKRRGARISIYSRHPILGSITVFGSLFLMAGSSIVLYFANLTHFQNVINILGSLGLFYARSLFQPDAQKLLVGDNRPPILLLRSFRDDKKFTFGETIAPFFTVDIDEASRSIFDFSLEARLADHFGSFGPFISRRLTLATYAAIGGGAREVV